MEFPAAVNVTRRGRADSTAFGVEDGGTFAPETPLESDDPVAPHRAALVEQTLASHRELPDLRVVGLVIEPDAPEAEAFRRPLPPEHRAVDRGLVFTMPRDAAVRLLGAIAPGVLDWIEDDRAGPRRRLPVIHVAKRGVRTTSIEYDAPE
jgi:hypothetical protein